MESYCTYTPTAAEQQISYANSPVAAGEQQTQVGPEWGQQFVDNFFQTQNPVSAPTQIYSNGEYVNAPTSTAYPTTTPPQGSYYQYNPSSMSGYIPSATQAPTSSYSYQQPSTTSYAAAPSTNYSYGAAPQYGYYDQSRGAQPQGTSYTTVPQFQAPQYNSYAPQGGSQVYMMPPVKKSTSHKKKKGMCC